MMTRVCTFVNDHALNPQSAFPVTNETSTANETGSVFDSITQCLDDRELRFWRM